MATDKTDNFVPISEEKLKEWLQLNDLASIRARPSVSNNQSANINMTPGDHLKDWIRIHNRSIPAAGIKNSGSYASYYDINPEWSTLQDVIEARKLNYAQGNILKAAFTFNIGRHDGTDEIRDLEKIIYFAKREIERIKKEREDAEVYESARPGNRFADPDLDDGTNVTNSTK